MGVDVRQDVADDEGTTTEGPSHDDTGNGTSGLAALRKKIAKARAERFEDMPVPGFPEIVVRYGPVESSELQRIYKVRRRAGIESGILSSADVLARSCLGIYEVGDDGELHVEGRYLNPDDGEPFTFATLDLVEDHRAVAQVRALYLTDGDVIAASNKVLILSGYEEDQESILGE